MKRQQATEKLAQKVMGWHKGPHPRWHEAWYSQYETDMGGSQAWNPWDDIEDTMELIKHEKSSYIRLSWYPASERWEACLFDHSSYYKHRSNNLPEAITLAVCKAYGIEVEEVGDA